MFSEAERRKVLRSEVICYIPGNFEAGNSLNLAVTVVVQHLLVTINALLPTDIRAMLPAQRFWWETVLLLDVM